VHILPVGGTRSLEVQAQHVMPDKTEAAVSHVPGSRFETKTTEASGVFQLSAGLAEEVLRLEMAVSQVAERPCCASVKVHPPPLACK
jgi:hypothetical protein